MNTISKITFKGIKSWFLQNKYLVVNQDSKSIIYDLEESKDVISFSNNECVAIYQNLFFIYNDKDKAISILMNGVTNLNKIENISIFGSVFRFKNRLLFRGRREVKKWFSIDKKGRVETIEEIKSKYIYAFENLTLVLEDHKKIVAFDTNDLSKEKWTLMLDELSDEILNFYKITVEIVEENCFFFLEKEKRVVVVSPVNGTVKKVFSDSIGLERGDEALCLYNSATKSLNRYNPSLEIIETHDLAQYDIELPRFSNAKRYQDYLIVPTSDGTLVFLDLLEKKIVSKFLYREVNEVKDSTIFYKLSHGKIIYRYSGHMNTPLCLVDIDDVLQTAAV